MLFFSVLALETFWGQKRISAPFLLALQRCRQDVYTMSNEDLLKVLEAHGQQFLQLFGTTVSIGKRKESPINDPSRPPKKKRVEENSAETWTGIGLDSDASETDSLSEDTDEEDEGLKEGSEVGTQIPIAPIAHC